jgi:hypothetical protein
MVSASTAGLGVMWMAGVEAWSDKLVQVQLLFEQ